jgi:DNA transposition AAA+ family ATPase
VNPLDRELLARWLRLIARLETRGAVTADEADSLRTEALEAIS